MSGCNLSDHSISDVVVVYHKKAAQDNSGSNGSILFREAAHNVDSDTQDQAEVSDDILDMLELSLPLKKKETERSIKDKDPNLVTRDGEGDPENPKNWSAKKKWCTTFIVSSFTFITPVSSSMVATALERMAAELQISSDVESQLVLSIFILAYAVGPLFLGPMSEIYVRVPVLQLANLFYFVFNLACGFAKTKKQLLAFRFLSGLGGSAPLAIGGGVLGDTWRAHERGKSLAVYSLAPLLGPAVGPIAGGFVVENSTWRWVFYATSIADAAIQVSGVFFLRETYAPKILYQKCKKLKKQSAHQLRHTTFPPPGNPAYCSSARYLYGIYLRDFFLVLSTFPTLWTGRYHESSGISSLNYVALGVGFFIGAKFSAPLNHCIFRRLKARNKGQETPEYRVPLMVPGSMLVPVGPFWYGWSAQMHTHWIVPDIGVGIFAIGTIVAFQCIQTYLVDAYTRYAASALAAATVLRSLAGFGFPLFAPTMCKALDYGWGNSVLAFVGIVLGVPAPLLLWRFGEPLRQKSPFAAGVLRHLI
ncbi:major facilitator superfamily domain-containing protein [Lipomyces doorenjongii]|uniref:major facilitator superfamily domain-containing protein n=1 Tax=Lipomyces doorenjongii TaxID=383834 RepID=UPI0034CDBE5D